MTTPWTPELTARVIQMKRDGISGRKIAKIIGVSRSAVAGKLFRMGLCTGQNTKDPDYMEKVRQSRRVIGGRNDWDAVLFEPYAVRKARLKEERANV